MGMGDCRGNFPSFIPKTDEMRVQSVPEVLDEIHGLPYVITLKYDGTSSTFCIDPLDDEFHACPLTLPAPLPTRSAVQGLCQDVIIVGYQTRSRNELASQRLSAPDSCTAA